MAGEKSRRLELLLARSEVFSSLSAQARQEIIAAAEPRNFKPGQVIYLEGEPAEKVYLLEKGWVKATRVSRKGREQGLLFLRPPEVFGDVAALTGENYPATTTTLENVDVWLIPSEVFLSLVQSHFDIALAMMRRLSHRILHFVELVEELSLKPVEVRLAGSLLQHVEPEGDRLIVPRRQWATLDEMATRMGTVRNVLSRGLDKLEADGYIKVEKKQIIILDLEGLADHADI